MPVLRTYQCPECEGIFEYLHESFADSPPEECELCHASMLDVQPELSAPKIGGSALAQSADQVYRDMERFYGVTDLHDNLREGDVAAKVGSLPKNVSPQFAGADKAMREATGAGLVSFGGGDLAGTLAASKVGGRHYQNEALPMINSNHLGKRV